MGFEPHSVVGSALIPASPTPAEEASLLARSSRKGLTPFEIPTVVGPIYWLSHYFSLTRYVVIGAGDGI